VILPDVNLPIYAYNSDSPLHPAARRWWEQTLGGPEAVGLAWISLIAFVRITTHERIFQNPLPVATAITHVKSWMAVPNVRILTPGDSHGRLLFDFLERTGTAGNLTTDAHLAALAMEYQATLATTDKDFSRFPGLKWINPLDA
jgi:toxin-antitoxin system PIN domain toxin